MKIQIQRSTLLDALKKVQNIAPGKGSLPILSNVKIEAADNKVTFTTSDLDLTLRTNVECEVGEFGATTLPVKLMATAVSKLAEGVVTISSDDMNHAQISSGNAKFKVNGITAEDFPKLPNIDADASTYSFKSKDLHDMIGMVQYASSLDETRRTLQGVNISFSNGTATVVATDGRRLALVEKNIELNECKEFSVTLPRKTVMTVMKELGAEGDVDVILSGSQILFRFGTMEIYSRIVDDSYPNYRQVIPVSTEQKLAIDRTSLLAVLDRVSVLSETSESKSVKLTFSTGMLTVSAATADIGEAKDQIAIKYDGTETNTMFNPSYIMDALKVIPDDEVQFEMNGGHSPVIIRDSAGFLYVLMPLRTN